MEKLHLIRQEVLQKRHNRNYGTISLNLPFSYKKLSIALIALTFSIVFILNITPVPVSGNYISLFHYLFFNFFGFKQGVNFAILL